MKKLYLITGATGHVGTVLIEELKRKKENIRILVLPNEIKYVPEGVEIIEGNICDKESLLSFFDRKDYDYITLIHAAAIVSIATKENPLLRKTNVEGTENILSLAYEYNIDRVIYVSSVHAIPEKPKGQIISEANHFDIEKVIGGYAKTKAKAAQIALDYADKGLNISIVHPSGIIGPGDKQKRNHMTVTIDLMSKGIIPLAIKGGYDFVDSRDVAMGILECEIKGRKKECYILSSQYITIKEILNIIRKYKNKKIYDIEIPYALIKIIAPIVEKLFILFNKKPVITPYSIYTLNSNSLFSHEKATKELGYNPKDIKESIIDVLKENI